MIIKPLEESGELRLWRCLKCRMELSGKEENNYLNLERGFKGEQMFDHWMMNLSIDHLVLNNLLLESGTTIIYAS